MLLGAGEVAGLVLDGELYIESVGGQAALEPFRPLDHSRAFLQRPAADALVRVHRALRHRGLGLTIFDAYRPWRVTKQFWDETPAAKRAYVADPRRGSIHNRGCAVDLTLYDLKTGKPVEMV